MKVNFNTFNFISSVKTFKRQNTNVTTFRSQLTTDVFIKTTNIEAKKEAKETLPQYLYHLTNKKCYNAIIRSGEIRPSKDTIDGVYMFDMKDFQDNWRTNPNYHKSRVLAEDLVAQAIKKETGLVLIQIPTEELNPDNFTIRPQDELNSYLRGEHFSSLKTKYKNFNEVLKHKDELPDYIKEGYPTAKANEFYEQGRAVEYIYKGAIDLTQNKAKLVFELPSASYKTFYGYSIKDYNNLFDGFKKATEEH